MQTATKAKSTVVILCLINVYMTSNYKSTLSFVTSYEVGDQVNTMLLFEVIEYV